jgi:hypothetical protein
MHISCRWCNEVDESVTHVFQECSNRDIQAIVGELVNKTGLERRICAQSTLKFPVEALVFMKEALKLVWSK